MFNVPIYYKDSQLTMFLGMRGALTFGCSAFWFLGVTLLPFGEAITLTMTCPVITVLMAACIVGEKVTLKDYMGAMVGFLGVVFIFKPPMILNLFGSDVNSVDHEARALGVLVNIIAGVLYAAVNIMIISFLM